MHVTTSDYESWVEDVDALCLTVVADCSPEEAARVVALHELAEFADVAAAEQWVTQAVHYDRSWFATGTIDGRTFVWEDNGWQGVTEPTATRLAGGGALASMFWNVESAMKLVVFDAGRVIRSFDPLFHDDVEPPAPVVGRPLDAEAGLDWEDAPRLSGLAVIARVCGTPPVQPSWLTLPGVRFWAHRF